MRSSSSWLYAAAFPTSAPIAAAIGGDQGAVQDLSAFWIAGATFGAALNPALAPVVAATAAQGALLPELGDAARHIFKTAFP